MTDTSSPFFSFRSSTASFVIMEVNVKGCLTSTFTTAATAPFSTDTTLPGTMFLALTFKSFSCLDDHECYLTLAKLEPCSHKLPDERPSLRVPSCVGRNRPRGLRDDGVRRWSWEALPSGQATALRARGTAFSSQIPYFLGLESCRARNARLRQREARIEVNSRTIKSGNR